MQEAQTMTTIPFERKPASSEEMKHSFKHLGIGIAVAIVFWFFGRWVISRFVGIGVLFFGYGFAYVIAPGGILYGIMELAKVFRSGRKKKPEDSFKWVWETSYFGDNHHISRFCKLPYSLATLERAVPSGITFDAAVIGDSIKNLRKTLSQAMDETTQAARKEMPGEWTEASPLIETRIDGSKELHPGVTELSATITYKDVISHRRKKTSKYVIPQSLSFTYRVFQ
jgi:hypothetical protein